MHLLQLSPTVNVERLFGFLRDVRVAVGAVDSGVVEARIPRALTVQHERRELAGYVATWNALNPSQRIELA